MWKPCPIQITFLRKVVKLLFQKVEKPETPPAPDSTENSRKRKSSENWEVMGTPDPKKQTRTPKAKLEKVKTPSKTPKNLSLLPKTVDTPTGKMNVVIEDSSDDEISFATPPMSVKSSKLQLVEVTDSDATPGTPASKKAKKAGKQADKSRTPATRKTPVRNKTGNVKTPVVSKTPVACKTPVVGKTPVASKTPVAKKTPVASKTPVSDKTPGKVKTPGRGKTPVKGSAKKPTPEKKGLKMTPTSAKKRKM